jgi:hypothetical protein
MRSGKSTLIEHLETVEERPWKVITPTEAAVFRKLDRDQPTLLLMSTTPSGKTATRSR